MSNLEVWHEHKVIATYPVGTEHRADADGALLIGGDRYEPGDWSAVGMAIVCAFLMPDDACPNCYPPSEES